MSAKNTEINLKKIRSEIIDLRKNLLNLKFQKSTGQLEKTSEIKKTRRKIASLKNDKTIVVEVTRRVTHKLYKKIIKKTKKDIARLMTALNEKKESQNA